MMMMLTIVMLMMASRPGAKANTMYFHLILSLILSHSLSPSPSLCEHHPRANLRAKFTTDLRPGKESVLVNDRKYPDSTSTVNPSLQE